MELISREAATALAKDTNVPVNDCISRQAAIEAIEFHLRVGDEIYPLNREDTLVNYGLEVAISCVQNLPTAEKVGRWIEVENKWGGLEIRCSECGEEVPRDGWGIAMQSAYCHNCGARMEGDGR